MHAALIVAVSIVGFCVFWCALVYLISLVSGWHALGERWRANDIFRGPKMSFCSGELLGNARYNNALTLGSDRSGLFMTAFFGFAPGHPDLFIPWEAIAISPQRRGIVFKRVGLVLDQERGITLWLPEQLAQRLLAQQERLRLSAAL